MASEKQIDANRRNAQHSTGPTTPEGKAAAAQNALKHGLFARKVIGEQGDERLQHYREQLTAEYQPRSFTEAALVEQMAVALFKRVTFEEVEASLEYRIAHGDISALQIVWRRQAALDREFHKALEQLQKLRKSGASDTPKARPIPTAKPALKPPSDPTPEGPEPNLPEPPIHDPVKYVMLDPAGQRASHG